MKTLSEILGHCRKRGEYNGSPCWIWKGYVRKGYGHVQLAGKVRAIHVIMFEAYWGPVPVGLEIDHLCRNPRCVNPEHLEAVTHAENNRRGASRSGVLWSPVTECRHGHPYTPENTYINGRGIKVCRVCKTASYARCSPRKEGNK